MYVLWNLLSMFWKSHVLKAVCRFTWMLTCSWGMVVKAPTRRPMAEVDIAVVRPQAAVEKTCHIIKPVGVPRNPWWVPIWGRAPVVSPVWGAASSRVSRQHQRACTVIAALLPRAMCRTDTEENHVQKGKLLLFSFLRRYKTWSVLLSHLPGLNCSEAVDTTWVISEHTAPLNVTTTTVSLK